MAIIQARFSRVWNSEKDNYDFIAADDYLVAAYSLSQELGKPYPPGMVLDLFINHIVREGTRPMDSRIDTEGDKASGNIKFPVPIPAQTVDGARNTKEMYIAFQCSDRGLKLTRQGSFTFMNRQAQAGAGFAEQILYVKQALANGQKFGWKGGTF